MGHYLSCRLDKPESRVDFQVSKVCSQSDPHNTKYYLSSTSTWGDSTLNHWKVLQKGKSIGINQLNILKRISCWINSEHASVNQRIQLLVTLYSILRKPRLVSQCFSWCQNMINPLTEVQSHSRCHWSHTLALH